MAELLDDTIDFTEYLRETEPASKVRPASEFVADVNAEFAERDSERRPEMFSTKLRGLIEFRPGEVTAWTGYSGHRKALALDTPIPTPNGWTTMGKVRVGEFVFDEHGEQCNVVGKSPVFLGEECFRLGFSDGTTVVAHAGHEWLTHTVWSRQSERTALRNGRVDGGEAKKCGIDQTHKRKFAAVRTTREIYDTLVVAEGGWRGHTNHSVRIARPLKLPESSLPIPPYVLGAWLGDGTTIDGSITAAEWEVVEQLVANGQPVVKRSAQFLYGLPKLRVALRALGVLGAKHIPSAYLRGSVAQREALLRGLMDTDGCAHLDGTLSFCSTKKALADGVAELVCSLGWQCSVRHGVAKLYGREIGPKWEVVFSADRPVFGVTRKQNRSKAKLSSRAKERFITKCERVQSEPVACIEVDSRSHLYLATNSMIPTHNSMFTGQVALDLCVQRERVLMVSLEMAPAKTMARMARQAFAAARPSPTHVEVLARWSDDRLWLFDHLGRISPALGLAVCRYFADKLKGAHVFLDSMMMVCASEESMDEQKQLVTDLVRLAQETGLHVHLVTHCRKPQAGDDKPPTKYDVRGSAAITDQVANVVTIWQNKPKARKLEINANDMEALAEPDARVAVEKQRNGAWEGSVKLWFDQSSLRFCDDRLGAVEPYRLQQ